MNYLILLSLFLLSSCNPSKTKLGEEFFAGVSVSLSQSTLTVSNPQVATSTSVTVTLSLKDENGVAYISARPSITFSKSGGTSVGILGAVTSHSNGTYTATFTGVTPGTATTIHAQVDGQEITSTLPTIQVTTGNFSLSQSTIAVSSATVTSGSTVTVTLTAKDPSGTQLPDGGLTVAFSNSGGSSTGTFSAVTDNLDGTYSATFTGVTSGTATNITATINTGAVTTASPTVTVNVGAAAKLLFVQGPTNTASGSTISPNVTVEVTDANNNRITAYATDIDMAIHTNPSSGTLSGTVTKTPASGVSTFNDLAINYYGTAYKLTATSGALTPAVSSAFNITATAVTHNIPYTSVTTPIYTTLYTSSSWSLMEFIGDLVRLTPTIQTDSSATEASDGTMTAGTKSGVTYATLTDGVNSGLKLGNDGSCNGATTDCAKQAAAEIYELNSSWTPQWANILGYWKLDNSWDASVGSWTGAAAGGTTFSSTSKIGSYGGIFDGVDGLVNLSNNATFAFADTAFTVSVWFKAAAGSTNQMMVTKGGTIAQMGWSIYITNTNFVRVNLKDTSGGGAADRSTSVAIADNNWHLLTAVITTNTSVAASNDIQLYIDGVLNQGAQTKSGVVYGNPGTSSDFGLGARGIDTVTPTLFYLGYLDDLAVWSVGLSVNEVQTIYERQKSVYSGTFTSRVMDAKSSSSWTTLSWNPTLPFYKELPDSTCVPVGPATTCSHNNPESASNYTSLVGSTGSTSDSTISTSGLVGLWHFNESSWADVDSEVKDDSGQANHGRAKSGAQTSAANKFGNAGTFDGIDDKLLIPDSTSLDITASITISTWIRRNRIGTREIFIGKGNGVGAGTSYWLEFPANNTLRFVLSDGGASVTSLYASLTVTDNLWHHVVGVYDGTTMRIYLDGQPSSQTTTWAGPIAATTSTLTIGSLQTVYYFQGNMDETAIWSRALHADEIKQLYQRGASRLKYQVRSCNDNACSGESWQAPDGTSATYFSELNNNTVALDGSGDVKATLPSMLFSNFTSPPSANQYFQYRTIFESDSTTAALWPELKSTTVDPLHYDVSSPSIYSTTGVAFSELNAFTQTLGAGVCPSGIGYNLSLDKTTWYWWNSALNAGAGGWGSANGTVAQSNDIDTINLNTATFGTQVGKGTVYVKAYLKSSGTSKCELDNIQVGGNR